MKENAAEQLSLRESLIDSSLSAPALEDDDAILIRALGPDNHREAEKLVELLSSYYGSGQPFDGVYDPEFWCSQLQDLEADRNILNIVAEEGGRFIAHIALRRDECSKRYEILLPAIHSDYRRDLFRMCRLFWTRIASLAERQSWSCVYQLSATSEAALQMISVKCFDSFEMALLPDPTSPGTHANACSFYHRNPLMLMMHIFRAEDEPALTLYPPFQHAQKIRELYAPLELPRTFMDDRRRAVQKSRPDSFDSKITAESVALTFDERTSLHQLTIVPSTLPDIEGTLAFISGLLKRVEQDKHRISIRVALDDKRCPALCAELEAIGLTFCGILPLPGEHDYLLYSKFDAGALEGLTLYTPRGRSLKDYILMGV